MGSEWRNWESQPPHEADQASSDTGRAGKMVLVRGMCFQKDGGEADMFFHLEGGAGYLNAE